MNHPYFTQTNAPLLLYFVKTDAPLLYHAGIVFFPPPSPISFFSSIPTHLFGASFPKKLFHLRFLALFSTPICAWRQYFGLGFSGAGDLLFRRRMSDLKVDVSILSFLFVCFLFQLLFLHFFILLKPQLGQPREGCFPANSGRRPVVEKLLPAFLNSVSLFYAFLSCRFLDNVVF